MTSMDEAHKKKLRENNMFLVNNITDVDGVVDYLWEKEIFTNTMKEDIEAEPTRTKKIRQLLARLPQRGPKAFQIFVEALEELGETHCARRLKPEGSQCPVSSPSCPDDEPMPDNWPDKYNPLEVQLVLCQDKQAMMNIINKKTGYSMLSDPRGLCVIINNEDFKQARDAKKELNDRTGTDFDCDGLHKLFDDMGFTVEIERNMEAQLMRKCLRKVAARDYSTMDCLVVFVLSHGEKGVVYGVDGEEMSIEDLLDQFNDQNCPALSSKPKLIFLQACQGKPKDKRAAAGLTDIHPSDSGADIHRSDSGADIQPSDSGAGASLNEKLQSLTVSDAVAERKKGSRSHFCFASATHEGLLAGRELKFGTWFIQAVIHIFKRYSHSSDLESMLTKVNALVNKAGAQQGFLQVSEKRSTLIEKLYFFPGLRMKDGTVEEYKPTCQQCLFRTIAQETAIGSTFPDVLFPM